MTTPDGTAEPNPAPDAESAPPALDAEGVVPADGVESVAPVRGAESVTPERGAVADHAAESVAPVPGAEGVDSERGAEDAGPESGAEGVAFEGGVADAASPYGDVRAGRRELGVWVGGAALGSVLVLVAAGREWVANVRPAGDAVPTGSELSPALTPLALAALAGVVAVLATKGVGRRLMGGLLALCGLAAAVASWRATEASTVLDRLRQGAGALTWDTTAWPYIAVTGALIVAGAGVVAIVRGGRWSAMSGRYERQTPAMDDRSLWDALDRGDDPTAP